MNFALLMLAFAIGGFGTRWLAGFLGQKGLTDRPTSRGLHSAPKPRGGGFAIVLAATLLGFVMIPDYWKIGIPALVIAGLGAWDDRKSVRVGIRLPVQLACSAWIAWQFSHDPTWIAPVALAIAWATNFYNFMDGVDGIAGMEGIFLGLTQGYFFWAAGYSALGLLQLGIALACAGFLFSNWQPARIFMGDVGSTFLGFTLASLAWLGRESGALHLSTILILWAAFAADTLYTLVVRLLSGQKIAQAHRSHAYQRAILLKGWSHRRVVLTEAVINLLWCFPLAWISEIFPIETRWMCVVLAYTPLFALAKYLGAGTREAV